MKEIRLRFDSQNRQTISIIHNFDFYRFDNIDGRNFRDIGFANSLFRGPELITTDIKYFPMIQETVNKLHYALYLLLGLHNAHQLIIYLGATLFTLL